MGERVGLVTGGAAGIGRATVLRLAADGVVVGALDRDTTGLAQLQAAAAAAGLGPRVVPLTADVTDEAAVSTAVAHLRERTGAGIDIVVNNAGVAGRGTFLDADDAEFGRLLAIHLHGALHTTRAVLPSMLERGSGVIVNVLSDGLWLGTTSVTYTTAKGALLGFTRSLAREVAPSGVRVNAVAPGPVKTRWLAGREDMVRQSLKQTPLGRAAEPDDIADAVVFLALGQALMTGQVLVVDGGRTM